MLRIFTVEYDPVRKSFDDSALATFLAGKSVISIEKRFFRQNSKFFWAFAIEYETEKIGGAKDIELETDAQKGLFLALKEWRNELAAEKGVPPYLLFTNNQLKQIALKQPKDLEEIKSYYSSSPSSNPTGPTSGSIRVRRSGGWNDDAYNCRVASRHYRPPNYSYGDYGFRVCMAGL